MNVYLPPEAKVAVASVALMVASAATLLVLRWFDREINRAVTFGSLS